MVPRNEPNPTLYRAVLAAPDDDAPRLAYADWFADNGHPERAEYIRLSCRIAQLPLIDPEVSRLQPDAEVLLWGHRRAWLSPRADHSPDYHWNFLRGFPEQVFFASFKALQESGDEVFRFHVHRLGFSAFRSARRLAAWPRLRQVRQLNLLSATLQEADVRALAESPFLEQLTWLTLGFRTFGPGEVEALASANWPNLRSLDLGERRHSAGTLGPAAARFLARSPLLTPVTQLGLRACGIGDEGLRELARSPHLRELTTMSIGNNQITAEGLAAVVEQRAWPRLRVLDLDNNPLGDAGAQQLAQATHWRDLQLLSVSRCMIGDTGVAALANAPHLANLRTWLIASNVIKDDGAVALAESAHLGQLYELALTSNLIGERGGLALAHSTRLPALRQLHVYGNAMRIALSAAIRERFETQSTERLQALAQAPATPVKVADPAPLPPGRGPADESGLLQAIADDPDDDVPKRIYADWLEENGDPEWAELIRLCLGSPFLRPVERQRGLVDSIVKRRGAGLPDDMVSCDYRTGLLTVITNFRTFQSKVFQDNAVAWFENARIQGLILYGNTKFWDRVAASPVLAAVRDLHLTNNALPIAGLTALCASPHVGGLHTLRLDGNRLWNQGLQILSRSTTFPRLRRLILPDNGINTDGLAALVEWPQLDRLTTLDLGRNRLQAANVAQLAGSPRLANLRCLGLQYNYFGDAGVIALAGARNTLHLEQLRLTSCQVHAAGATALAQLAELPKLTELYLSDNPLGDEAVLTLVESPRLAGVRRFEFARCNVSTQCRQELQRRHGDRVRFE